MPGPVHKNRTTPPQVSKTHRKLSGSAAAAAAAPAAPPSGFLATPIGSPNSVRHSVQNIDPGRQQLRQLVATAKALPSMPTVIKKEVLISFLTQGKTPKESKKITKQINNFTKNTEINIASLTQFPKISSPKTPQEYTAVLHALTQIKPQKPALKGITTYLQASLNKNMQTIMLLNREIENQINTLETKLKSPEYRLNSSEKTFLIELVKIPHIMSDSIEKATACLKINFCKTTGIKLDEIHRQIPDAAKTMSMARTNLKDYALISGTRGQKFIRLDFITKEQAAQLGFQSKWVENEKAPNLGEIRLGAGAQGKATVYLDAQTFELVVGKTTKLTKDETDRMLLYLNPKTTLPEGQELPQNLLCLDAIPSHKNIATPTGFLVQQNTDSVEQQEKFEVVTFMPLMDGEIKDLPPILARIKNDHPDLYNKLVLSMALQTLGGLDALHDRGIVHQDIKPENCMFKLDESVDPPEVVFRWIDFDIGADYGSRGALQSVDLIAEKGTKAYHSPNRVLASANLAADTSGDMIRSEISSVAISLFRAITGKHPTECLVGTNQSLVIDTIEGEETIEFCQEDFKGKSDFFNKRFAPQFQRLTETLTQKDEVVRELAAKLKELQIPADRKPELLSLKNFKFFTKQMIKQGSGGDQEMTIRCLQEVKTKLSEKDPEKNKNKIDIIDQALKRNLSHQKLQRILVETIKGELETTSELDAIGSLITQRNSLLSTLSGIYDKLIMPLIDAKQVALSQIKDRLDPEFRSMVPDFVLDMIQCEDSGFEGFPDQYFSISAEDIQDLSACIRAVRSGEPASTAT